MALIFWEGFDLYGSQASMKAARPEFNMTFGMRLGAEPAAFGTTGGRYNGGRLVQDNILWGPALLNTTVFGASPTELYTGRAVYLPNGLSDGDGILQVFGNAFTSTQGDVYFTCGSGLINAYNFNGTLLGSSPASTIISGTWFWLEARVKMSSNSTTADGIVEVWVNNRQVISNTACITKRSNSSTGYGGINLLPYYPNGGNVVDDFYITDTTGSAPWNTRLGDCRIATITVNADAGPNQGVVASGNPAHYTAVADVPFNSTDYITLPASASGSGEIFGHATLPSTNTFSILATAVVGVARKTDAGNAAFKLSLKTGSNTYNSNTQYLATSNAYFRQEWVTNPNTSSQWTVSDWTTANLGFYVV